MQTHDTTSPRLPTGVHGTSPTRQSDTIGANFELAGIALTIHGILLYCYLLLCSVGALTPAWADAPSRIHHYRLEADEGLTTLKARACFNGAPPLYLVAESLDASTALKEARIEGSRRDLEPNGTELKLKGAARDTCVLYTVDISPSAARHERGGNLSGWAGDDLVVDVGRWFWRPQTLAADEDIRLEFVLPEGVAISAPWKRDEGRGGANFRAGHTPADWPAVVAFGRFKENVIAVPGATLRVAVLGVTPKIDAAQIAEWVRNAALGVTTVHGKFPVPEARVLVVPNAQGNEPVPWAFVQRGGGPSAQFLINHRLPAEAFVSDWTLFHELAHLLLPYIGSQDAWLSEGVASYYQNLLRARRGVITPLDAWQRLHAGFERGRKSQIGVTLADATERMYLNAGFMRVYWQGAAIALLADYRLRVQGHHSLDSALGGLARCCLPSDKTWSGREVLERLDAITSTSVFTELYDRYIRSEAFPDLSEVYQGLGLQVQDKELRFTEGSPHTALRDSMMSIHD